VYGARPEGRDGQEDSVSGRLETILNGKMSTENEETLSADDESPIHEQRLNHG
jgi:hypothetical protein